MQPLERRYRLLRISYPLLVQLLCGWRRLEFDVDGDITVLTIVNDVEYSSLSVLIHNPRFDVVPAGQKIPVLNSVRVIGPESEFEQEILETTTAQTALPQLQ